MNLTKMTKLMAVFGLGLSSLACGTNDLDDANLTPDGLPPLTAEEQAVVDNMNKNTLAEIDLPEGKMKFVEFAPGQVSIMRQIRIGAEMTRVEGEGSMTLDQIFLAYAPERQVPREVMDAMGRVAAFERTAAPGPVEAAGPADTNLGTRVEQAPVISPDGTERVQSALASSINQTWFSNTFCHVSGPDWTWCYAVAWQGAYAQKKTHRSNSVTCGDTGSARVNFHVGGTLKTAFDVPYGQCWYSGSYEHSHGWFGVNNEVTQKYSVPVATGQVRFAGWMADEDQFIGSF